MTVVTNNDDGFRVKRARIDPSSDQESHLAPSHQKLSELIKALKTSLEQDIAKMEAEALDLANEKQSIRAKFKALKTEDLSTVKAEVSELAKKLSYSDKEQLYLDYAHALVGTLQREDNESIFSEYSDCLEKLKSIDGNPSLIGELQEMTGNCFLTRSKRLKGFTRTKYQKTALICFNNAIENYRIADLMQKPGLKPKHQDNIQRLSRLRTVL